MDKEYLQTYKENLCKRSLEEMNAKLDIRGEKRKLLLQFVIGAILTGIVVALGYLGLTKESGLVFTTDIGTPINPHNMLKHFKAKIAEAGERITWSFKRQPYP